MGAFEARYSDAKPWERDQDLSADGGGGGERGQESKQETSGLETEEGRGERVRGVWGGWWCEEGKGAAGDEAEELLTMLSRH